MTVDVLEESKVDSQVFALVLDEPRLIVDSQGCTVGMVSVLSPDQGESWAFTWRLSSLQRSLGG